MDVFLHAPGPELGCRLHKVSVHMKNTLEKKRKTHLWTWRPGFAAQFVIPSTWLEPNEPRDHTIVLTRGEERVLDRALEAWQERRAT